MTQHAMLPAGHDLASALRRRTERGQMPWRHVQCGSVTYFVGRVRSVTAFLAWHANQFRPDLMIHTSATVVPVAVSTRAVLDLWDAVRAVLPAVMDDPAAELAVIQGATQLADAPDGV